MKKFLSVILILILVLSSIMTSSYVFADEISCTLTQTVGTISKTGTNSEFILKVPHAISIDEAEKISISDTSVALDVIAKSEMEFLITPTDELKNNKVYMFTFELDGKNYRWAFQTEKGFNAISTYPSNEAYDVPINTGIEITLSEDGFSVSDNGNVFSIEPHVDGRYEIHGKTLSFIPNNALEYDTVYTVAVDGDISSADGKKLKPFKFEFSTISEDTEADKDRVTMNIDDFSRFSVGEETRISFSIYSRVHDKYKISYSLYKIQDFDSALDLVRKKLPYRYTYLKNLKSCADIDVSAFDKIGDYEKTLKSEESRFLDLEFGSNLSDGYYAVRVECKNADPVWTVFQITDNGADVFVSDEKSVVWVNNIKKSKPIPDAEVMYNGEESVKTDSDGVAYISSSEDKEKLVIIKIPQKSPLVICAPSKSSYRYYNAPGGINTYWSVIQTDRDIYKSNDTVNVWGFISKRDGTPIPEKLTLSIGEAYYGDNSIIKEIIKPKDGIFEATVNLSDFDEGYYHVSVSDGERTVCQSGFSVENFIKPEYKMTSSVYPKALFDGEKIEFNVNTAFYDGTPLSNTDISYRISYGTENLNENEKTDIKGNMSTEYVPKYNEGMQGSVGVCFDAESTIPNFGQIGTYQYANVMVNDIVADFDVSKKNGSANISAEVNKIDLSDARETGNISYDNIKGSPAANKEINIDIYKNYYEKKVIGTYYDYIEKRTYNSYSYTEKSEKIKSFKISTGSDGKANKKFSLPQEKEIWYNAEIELKDSNGRIMRYTYYIGEEYSFKYGNQKYFELKKDKDVYDVGDKPLVSVLYGDKPATNSKTMFIRAKTQIDDVCINTDNSYELLFDENTVPNCKVYAIVLAPDGYHFLGAEYIGLDFEKRKLNIKVNTDKSSYSPGDSCTVTIDVADLAKKEKCANLNLSFVDKALLDISNYTPDTLSSLYTNVYHRFWGNTSTNDDLVYRGGGGAMKNEMSSSTADSLQESAKADTDAGGASNDELREDFKDTAAFASVKTDEHGRASYTFTLPDNITSWRLYVSAVTDDCYAGNNSFDISVGLPMFISYTLSDTFLTGDIPSVGVNVYGTSLKAGDDIKFTLTDPENQNHVSTVYGKAFERVNIPLWKITDAGEHSVIIRAESSSGITDSVRCKYASVDSYRTYTYGEFKELNPSDSLSADGAKSMVRIRFTDGERGKIISGLMRLIWQSYGDRVEKKITRVVAKPIVDKYFGIESENEDMSLADYINSDGGLSILPEAASDPEVTALALNFVSADEIGSKDSVVNYLRSIYDGDNSDNKIAALYGLALLGEPVMDEVEKYSLLDGLSARDAAYVGLCFASYGNIEAANSMFAKLKEKTVYHDPYLYIDESDKDKSIASTSAALMLGAKIGAAEADGYYKYCMENYTSETLKIIEELIYLENKLDKLPETDAALTYSIWGEEKSVNFKTGENAYITLPSSALSELKIVSSSGGAGAVVNYQKSIGELINTDNTISVKRKFYKVGDPDTPVTEFKVGDIIRVNLWVEYGEKALDGAYTVSEYLPSGLEYVADSAKIPYIDSETTDMRRVYAFVSGKKVVFRDYNCGIGCGENGGKLYYYYARVVTTGKYRAEGTTVQKINAQNTLTFGSDDHITIYE